MEVDGFAVGGRRRKRKCVEEMGNGYGLNDGSPSGGRMFVSQELVECPLLCNALQSGDEHLIKMILTTMKDKDVRRVAAVNKTWAKIVYEILRERNGNYPFLMLWLGENIDNFSFRKHFHPSYLNMRGVNVGSTVVGVGGVPNETTQMRAQTEVETVLVFCSGNDDIMGKFIAATEERDLPSTKALCFIAGTEVFFTTPDLHASGDSMVGVYQTLSPISFKLTTTVLASICVPKHPCFKLEVTALTEKTDLNVLLGRLSVVQHELETKAIVVLKLYDSKELDASVARIIGNYQTKRAKSPIHFVSQECLFVGWNGPDCHTFLSGLALSFLGTRNVQCTTVGFHQECNSEELKFRELQAFVASDRSSRIHSFAILFAYWHPGKESSVSYARNVFYRFRSLFPDIPIHGIATDKPIINDILSCSDQDIEDLTAQMSHMHTTRKMKNNHSPSVVILVVLYPSEQEESFHDVVISMD